MEKIKGIHIQLSGIVQGVGFRPFVYNLAVEHELKGWVKNTSSGLEIDVDGSETHLKEFVEKIKTNHPSLASIDNLIVTEHIATDHRNFEILKSETISSAFQPISPDIATCPDCLRELFDQNDRRYRYPFINCTNCGPRFTIIQDIPYDRPKTSMSMFTMCPACAKEYQDPTNRRFHAQPIACPDCGPKLWLENYHQTINGTSASVIILGDDAVQRTRQLIKEGKIVAIKGLGGFHLACNAKNPVVVTELRTRKLRVDKPFAVMMPDIETVRRHCHISDAERKLLESPSHPIVLLQRRSISMIASEVAPNQRTIGVMLPYTPLHYLLMEKEKGYPEVLVMTSGNISDEPIRTDNIEARQTLDQLADAFLMHDRDIYIRTDDSVMRVFDKQTYPIRRSRGYAPYPVQLPWATSQILAVGAELKNTFCITNKNYAFLSHHIGDLENYETLKSFENGIAHYEQLFRVTPVAIGCDLHPDYLSTRYAKDRSELQGIPLIGVQHHHAHIASLMTENGLGGTQQVIGVAFDGTGFGTDGAIWGGEFMIADYSGFERISHLPYFPLPGGDASIRRPSKTALSLLYMLGIDWDEGKKTFDDLSALERNVLAKQLESRVNTTLTSSAGRLFDAVASLAGVRHIVNYEAQAAIELEALALPEDKGFYEFYYNNGEIIISSGIKALLSDINNKIPAGEISTKFHNGIANLIAEACNTIRKDSGLSDVALSGGVWQNMTLLHKTVVLLEKSGFKVFFHKRVPANDGGVALGQAVITAYRLGK